MQYQCQQGALYEELYIQLSGEKLKSNAWTWVDLESSIRDGWDYTVYIMACTLPCGFKFKKEI